MSGRVAEQSGQPLPLCRFQWTLHLLLFGVVIASEALGTTRDLRCDRFVAPGFSRASCFCPSLSYRASVAAHIGGSIVTLTP